MAYREIATSVTTTFIPDNYPEDKDVSVLVFYPGISLGDKNPSEYMIELLKKAIPTWFDRYVIVVPNTFAKKWIVVKNQFEAELNARKIKVANISIGIYSQGGKNSTDITERLSYVTKLKNVMLMDPEAGNVLQDSIKKVRDKGSSVYMLFNYKNWSDDEYGSVRYTYLTLPNVVGTANVINTNSGFRDHPVIPSKFLNQFNTKIQSTLVTNIEEEEEETATVEKEEKFESTMTFNVEKEETFIIVSTGTQSTSTGTMTGATASSGKGSEIGELAIVDESELFTFQSEPQIPDEFLDDEFTETDFDGVPQKEWEIQGDVADNQEDSFSNESTPTPEQVDIQPVNNFDDLLRLAGKLARELGKNERVKYENLKRGYVKGIHGLCPQGTQAVLAALTGIKGLGRISGNADWFSFKTPGTGGGNSSFAKSINGTVYYNDKVRITQKNGSWKETYIQDKSQWQVGDIVVMGYTGGKKYGHIQIWTGYNWMSDFKQNRIQQNNVDPNTVALWRLNENGVNAVKAQSGVLA